MLILLMLLFAVLGFITIPTMQLELESMGSMGSSQRLHFGLTLSNFYIIETQEDVGHHHFDQSIGVVDFYFSVINGDFSHQFLFIQIIFLFLQLEYPMVATNLLSYFLFPDYFSPFQMVSCHYSFFAFALINIISGCLRFLGIQLYFKDANCTSQGCFCFTG